ncbi:MAG: hypothetical protein JST30_15145 [Armatimonadetes bacterium]|nr:hypothetical protein [Armatimonadota bacterium]
MHWKLRSLVSALALLTVPGASAQWTVFGKRFEESVIKRIEIIGSRRLAYHTRSVSGDRESYDAAEYGGRGLSSFTDFGQVRITGTNVLDVFNFDLNIQDSRFADPQANRASLDVDKGNWKVNLGDIRGSLGQRNAFARFQKTLSGGQVAYKSRGLEMRGLYSEVRGEARTVSVQGNNTPGPYYLQSSQIVRGSEQIKVDGVLLNFGEDYSMDYDLGSVTFVNRMTNQARIIPPTSTIVATYEVFGFNGTKGRLEGAEIGLDLGKAGRLGVTGMRQVQGVSNRNSTYEEQILTPIAANEIRPLRFEPLDILTVQVYIGSKKQTLGIGYDFPTANKSLIRFLVDVPPNTFVQVIYTPRPVDTVQGDRSVVGLDYTFPLGKNGSLLYSQALGRLTNTSAPSSGTARGVNVNYRFGKARLTGSFVDVPTTFVGIETAGFARNERTTDARIAVNPSERVEYGFGARNSAVSNYSGTGTVRPTRFTSVDAFYQFSPNGKGSPWRLSQQRTTAKSLDSDSKIDQTTFGTSGATGRAQWRFDLSNQFASGFTTVDNDRQKSNFDIQSLSYNLGYTASRAWTLNMNSSLSRIHARGETGIGRDIVLGAAFRPSDKFSVSAQFADSDAGRIATLGFDSGYGLGYGGNGFSSGADSTFLTGASNARTAALSMTYSPTDAMTLSSSVNYYRSEGGVSSNTESIGFGLGANMKLGRYTDFDAFFDANRMKVIDSDLTTTSSNISFFVNHTPKGRFSARGGLNVLLSGGNGQFNQDSVNYEASLAYKLAARHALVFSTDNGRFSGYQPQDTRTIALTYQYQIWRSLALNVGYRIIDVTNRDSSATSGAYSSRGLDIELQFNFGRY